MGKSKTGRPVGAYSINNHGKYKILVKCPHCEKKYIIQSDTKPLVMPRIFCLQCAHLRRQW